jgi:flagellar export protein FliJ
MKKFNFNLEALLKLRKHKEMQAQLGFAEIQRVKTSLNEQINQAQENIEQYSKPLAQSEKIGTAFAFNQAHAFVTNEFQKIASYEDQLKNLAPLVDIRRRQLVEANQQTSILEKLREQKKIHFQAEQRQLDTAAMDENATMRFNIYREHSKLK